METIATWLDRSQNHVLELQQKRKEGIPVVGYIPNGYVPIELIYACGAESVPLFYGGEASPVSASTPYLGRFIDPFCRAQIGYKLGQESPLYQTIDLLIVPITDQHNRGISDSWNFYTDVEVFPLGIPKAKTRQAFEYYLTGLNRLKKRLEVLTGNEITTQMLKDAIEHSNRIRDLFKKISLLRISENPPITGKEFIQVVHNSFDKDPAILAQFLEGLWKELKDREPATDSSRPRVLFTGSTLAYGDYKVLDLLEEAGASVVIEEFCEGMRDYWQQVDVNGDPVLSLVNHYLMKKMPGAFFRGSTKERFSCLKDLVRQFNVNGVLWLALLFRETYDIERYLFEQASEFLDLPKLTVQSNYDAGETESFRTRIETFVTIIERGR